MKPEAENRGSTTSGAPIVRHSEVFHCGSMYENGCEVSTTSSRPRLAALAHTHPSRTQ